jgi:prepilin-type N-terminal cleavage/methylation domain-containing protein
MPAFDSTRFPNGTRTPGRKGFTLVEVIAALALLGVLTAVFGMGIVAAARSFTFSRENVLVAQKGRWSWRVFLEN